MDGKDSNYSMPATVDRTAAALSKVRLALILAKALSFETGRRAEEKLGKI
jgi:hypothetical protein